MRDTARSFALGRVDVAAAVLFLVVAAVLTWNADASFGFGLDQVSYNLITEEILTAWDQGQPLRNEHGSIYRQSFVLLLALGQRLLGSLEVSYRLILFLSAGAYLVAMYILLVTVLEDRRIAALTAVLSIVQRYTLGTSFWGMGEYQSILPRIVVLAVFPLAWLLFERHLRSPRVLVSFVVVALGFTLHLSAVYFYCILLLTYGLHVVWSRNWASILNVVIATAFLWFALKAVPGPSWSQLMETSTLAAMTVALIGLGLVFLYSRLIPRPWMGIATVLYLGWAFVWLLGGTTIESIVGFGPSATEIERQAEVANQQQAAAVASNTEVSGPVNPGLSSADPEVDDRTGVAEQTGTPDQNGGEVISDSGGSESAAGPKTNAGAAVADTDSPEIQLAESGGVEIPDHTPSSDRIPPTGENLPDADEVQLETPETILESTNRALYARFGWMLFPISLASLGFALYNVGLLGAVALYELIYRWRRGATERERIIALYVFSVLAVSLGLTGAVQLYCRIAGRPDMILELFRALRYIYLPLYIYLGLFLERMWRQLRARPAGRARLLFVALIVALLVSPRQALTMLPDRVKLLARSVAESSGALNSGDPSQRRYLYLLLATDAERQASRAEFRDFLELCDWVKDSTTEDSVFLTTDYNFIYHADRDIMVSYQQGAGSARSMSVVSGHRAWHEAYQEISDAFTSRSPERLLAAAREYGADYIVTTPNQALLNTVALYSNPSYALYKVPPSI